MRTYDIIFILDERKFEDGGEAFAKDVAAHLQSLGAAIKSKQGMGRRTFARPIGKSTAGIYWEFIADLDPAKVALFQDKYRLNASIMRMQASIYVPVRQAPRAVLEDSVKA